MDDYIQLTGELFEKVQLARIFPDSKTFVDSIPVKDPRLIIQEYESQKLAADFDLAGFVKTHFRIPESIITEEIIASHQKITPFKKYIESLWPVLTHTYQRQQPFDTLLSLPHSYIVPGGRFREFFYWDSFFIAVGLVQSGLIDGAIKIVDNMRFLIEQYGYVPNANRIYLANRSQAPMYAQLLAYLKPHLGARFIDYLPSLETEYQFWMSKRAVTVQEKVFNRYISEIGRPREEAYFQDYHLVKHLPVGEKERIWKNLRAASESGWDFSSRFLKDPADLSTIQTDQIIPVDLNCLLYSMEEKLGAWYEEAGESTKALTYTKAARARGQLIQTEFWSETSSFFYDLQLNGQLSERETLAAIYPLYVGVATAQQAQFVAYKLQHEFLQPGGLLTTLVSSGQQWDCPNGWAPLQWVVVTGLIRYGFNDLASQIKKRFIATGEKGWQLSGTIWEKYNVVSPLVEAKGGEYTNQIGFGWTNGVLLDFL